MANGKDNSAFENKDIEKQQDRKKSSNENSLEKIKPDRLRKRE